MASRSVLLVHNNRRTDGRTAMLLRDLYLFTCGAAAQPTDKTSN